MYSSRDVLMEQLEKSEAADMKCSFDFDCIAPAVDHQSQLRLQSVVIHLRRTASFTVQGARPQSARSEALTQQW